MPQFKLPDLGEGVTEAEIDRWLVKEGDTIGEDEPLVDVITDKASAEIPSPFEGVIARIHVSEGEVVSVGTILVTIGEEAGDAPIPGPAEGASGTVAPPTPLTPDTSSVGGNGSGSSVKAMPPVRKLARELGIDLTAVAGSGPEGRILRRDVEAHAGGATPAPTQRPPAPPSAPAAPASELPGKREPLRGVRRKIAERMAEAHRRVPPVTHVEECDVTELDATRRLANERDEAATRLTYLPFIVKAVVSALKDYPALNSSLDEEAGEIIYHGDFNIGIAVDTPSGLVVPVVKNADRKRLREIASEIERFARAGRQGNLDAADLQGGTFTVTSPGPFGGLMATPIVMWPQAGILGVHRAIDRPVVRDGQVVVRKMMNFSVSFDHRILDGMTAARFVLDVVKLLEHPAVLALES
jgi:pyruvate dehydrogenase E2 component (dihydrolipoamide acetyltransferase)